MSAASFPSALAFTLKYEGGKSNDPHDPGGRTNQGITQRTYDAYCKRNMIAARDVYSMSSSVRDEIYKHEYWSKVTGDSLPSGVDLAVFDYAVNSGPERALRSYASVGYGKKQSEAIHALCSKRLSFLHALRTWRFFGSGWSKRVAACEVEALKLANAPLDKAHDRVKKSSVGLTSRFIVLSTVIGVIVGKGWHELSWTNISIIAAFTILLVIYFIHKNSVFHVRANIIEDEITKISNKKQAALDKADAEMKAAVDKMKGK